MIFGLIAFLMTMTMFVAMLVIVIIMLVVVMAMAVMMVVLVVIMVVMMIVVVSRAAVQVMRFLRQPYLRFVAGHWKAIFAQVAGHRRRAGK